MQIVVTGVKPYDGSYELDFADELTTREFGWIKRLAGYLPLELDKAVEGGDPEFMCVLAAIALRRAGKIEAAEVPQVFERFADAPFGTSITVEIDETDQAEDEGDAGPPVASSTGNESSSGNGSKTSSETSPSSPPGSGIHGSATSVYVPSKSVS